MVITYNAALNKTAYQSSLYDNGNYPPQLANDGSRHTTFNTGTKCAVQNPIKNPWWAVDLGQPTTVYRVDLTSSDNAGRNARL